MPLLVVGTSFLANGVYAFLLKGFPFVAFTSVRFVAAIGNESLVSFSLNVAFCLVSYVSFESLRCFPVFLDYLVSVS
eukprot:m.25322 g.25322  ORF g.25322 m.25322 type:complete len:77 (+) comp28777_c0_seq4:262-492(+)